jgi:RNA polymerase sigma-70 factor (ECF subfamily)
VSEIHKRLEAEIPRLRRYARALVRDVTGADDLVQECLMRALSKLDLWHEGTNLRAWLFTILHNQHVNHVRRSIRIGAPVEFCDDGAPAALSLPANQEKRLELRDLERALSRLPQEQRAVIFLVGLEGMPYGDVAVVLGVPVGTVRSRLSRGRSALRQLMDMGSHAGGDERVSNRTGASRRRPAPLPTRTEQAALATIAG